MNKCRIILTFGLCLTLLSSCLESGRQHRAQLEELERQNRADSLMFNDSLAEALVDYFDSHGTSNERMRTRYILGRTYYDLGELPRALETYLEAADCADTTAVDCEFGTLSRVHAQMADIYYEQLLPQNQLKELMVAGRYAQIAKDTLMAVECFADQATAFSLMKNVDSVIMIKDRAYKWFMEIGRRDRAAQTVCSGISALVQRGKLDRAKEYIDAYERESGYFDAEGNIKGSRKIFYYIKGDYYLHVGQLDSAELMFRKILREGSTLNHQIAGNKGLQEVFSYKRISDSIAKYANLCYVLNDSAYSLAEISNIQQIQASYNYNHHKALAEQEKLKAERLWLVLTLIVVIAVVSSIYVYKRIHLLQKMALDFRLRNAAVTRRLRMLSRQNPPQLPNFSDWKELKLLVEGEIPTFPDVVGRERNDLSDFEYDLCLLVRVNMAPNDISKLKNCSPSHVSNTRKRLLYKVFEKEGRSEDFDDEIGKIGN